MVPRLVVSPCRRARNLRLVGLSWPRSSDCAAILGWVASQEGGELCEVYAVLAVVVLRVSLISSPRRSWKAARASCRFALDRMGGARKRRADEAFQAAFGGIGCHGATGDSSQNVLSNRGASRRCLDN